jgi:isopropylmalate/homocitrate/citramalate synthase
VTAASVEIVEVSPRDGLQNESEAVSTEDKLRLIERAVNAGIRRLEIASFVNPKRVPQMADAEEVIARAPRAKDITYIGLVMNQRGAQRAFETEIDQLGLCTKKPGADCTRDVGCRVRNNSSCTQRRSRSDRHDFLGVRLSI